MKKLLALVLALVMTLGLATVSSSAAYSDKADINYNEAVDVMTAVGVFQGKGSNFDPKANLNRAEAAKIVAYLMLGNDAAEAIKGTGSKFTDVPADHWASGYIEYLASAGVLSGVGGGKFDPNGQVTAIQLAKMLLVALGYDAEIEGFVGSDWAINIQKVANKVGIYDGNDAVVGNNPVTRDEAALYTFNTVKSPMVEYETTTTVNIGDANVKVGSNNWKYMTTGSSSSRYDNIDDAVTNDNNQAKIIEFGEQQWSNLVRDSSGDDGFGREKVVWTYKGTTVGEYTDKSDLIFTSNKKVEKGAMYDLFGSNDYDKLAAGKASVQLRVFWDGEKRDVDADGLSTYLEKNNTKASGMSGNGILTEVYRKDVNENYRYGYYSDSYNYTVYTIVQVTTYVAQATANYNATREDVTIELLDTESSSAGTDNSITLGNGTTIYRDKDLRPANFATSISAKDFPAVKDVKEDDYLLVTWSTSDKEYGTVAVAEKRVGTVSQYKDNDYVYLDGEKVDYNATVGKDDENGKSVTYSINEKATVVLDSYGYIIYVDEALTTSSYVYVGEVADNSRLGKEFIGDAYFLDGTNKSIVIKKVDNTTVTNDNDLNGWYTFTVNSDKEYTLKTVKSTGDITTRYAVNTAAYGAGNDSNEIVKNSTVSFMKYVTDATVNATSVFTQSGTTNARNIKANSNTEFIVYDKANDDTTAYKGIASVPDVTLNKNAAAGKDVKISYAMNSDGTFAKLVYIWMDKANADGTNDGSYTMLLTTGTNKVHKENTDYLEFDVVTDGTLKEKTMIDTGNITLNKGDVSKATKGILLTKVKTNSDDYITSASEVGSSSDKEKKINLAGNTILQSGNTITLADNSFVVTSDSKLNMVIGPDATDPKLLNKIGDDYNIYANTSIGAIAGMVKAYDHITDGVAYVVTTEKGNDKIDVLYVWINGVSKTANDGTYTITTEKGNGDAILTSVSKRTGLKAGDDVTVKVTASSDSVNPYLTGVALTSKSIVNGVLTATFKMPASNVTLTYGETAGTTLYAYDFGTAKPSSIPVGSITNLRLDNAGNILATMTIDPLEWAAAGKATLVGTVYIDGADYAVGDAFKVVAADIAGTTGTAKKAITLTSDTKLAAGIVDDISLVEFGDDIAVKIQKVRIRYLDGDNSNAVLTPNDTTGKIKKTTTVKDALTTTGQTTDVLFNTKFTGAPNAVTPNGLQYTVNGITDPVANKTTFTNSTNLKTTAGRLAANPIALGTGFVDVTVYGLSDLAKLEPYAITSVFDGGKKIGNADAKWASHALKDVVIAPTYTATTGTAGQNVAVKYAITNAGAVNLSGGDVGYKMTLSDGTVFYFNNGATLATLTNNANSADGVKVVYGDATNYRTISTFVDKDIKIEIANIEEISGPTISKVEYADVNLDQKVGFATSGDTISVVFSEKLSAVPTTAIANTDGGSPTITGNDAFAAYGDYEIADGRAMTITFDGSNIDAADVTAGAKITFGASTTKLTSDLTGMVNRLGMKIVLPVAAPAANGLTATQITG